MLVKCPECELQVSDKAVACPHCGYPLGQNINPRKQRGKVNKRRRLPNGFGQISEIKNRNLRNPFRVMITVGKDVNGRPICKLLKPESYFPTYNDAYMALVEYNKNPYDLDQALTVQELYEKWLDEYSNKVKNINPITTAWCYCAAVYNLRVKDLRARHIKNCMEKGVAVIKDKKKTPNAFTKNHIKSLFNMMLDYAVEYELVDKNYSRTFTLTEETIKEMNTVKNEHIPFTEDEMKILWKHADDKNYLADILLIQCYSGWRPQELCFLKISNVDLKKGAFTGGMKTDSGKDRIVPIHPRIRRLVERKYQEAIAIGSPYLFNYINENAYRKNMLLTYARYQQEFNRIVNELGLNAEHRPHDGRKHFVTMAKKYNVDEYAIKYMVGHKISDITEKTYTSREFDWLMQEIEKIR